MDEAHSTLIIMDSDTDSNSTDVIFDWEWNKAAGTREITIKCIEDKKTSFSLGVTTNLVRRHSIWLFDDKLSGLTYQLFNDRSVGVSMLCSYKDGKEQYMHEMTDNCIKPGDTLTMRMDFIAGKIEYYVDKKKFGESMKIDANKNYYPAISCNTGNIFKISPERDPKGEYMNATCSQFQLIGRM